MFWFPPRYRWLFLLGLILLPIGCGGGASVPDPDPEPDPDPIPLLPLAWWDSVSTAPDYARPTAELVAEGITTIFISMGDLTERASTPRVTIPIPDPPIFYPSDHVASGEVARYVRETVPAPEIDIVPELPVSELYRLQPSILGRDPVAADFANVIAFVDTLESDPAVAPRIGGYMLVDEPSLWPKRWVTPSFLAPLVAELRLHTTKTLYINFEVSALNGTTNPTTLETFPPLDLPAWRDLADVFMYDEYPYLRTGDSDPLAAMIRFDQVRRALAPKPATMWLQGFGETDFPDTPVFGSQTPQQKRKLRHPTGSEARYQAWTALATGSEGLAWFVIHWIPADMRRDRYGPVAEEVQRLRGLLAAPDLLASDPRRSITIAPPDCTAGGAGLRSCLPPQVRLSRDPLSDELILLCINRAPFATTFTISSSETIDGTKVGSTTPIDPFAETPVLVQGNNGGAMTLTVTLPAHRMGMWRLDG